MLPVTGGTETLIVILTSLVGAKTWADLRGPVYLDHAAMDYWNSDLCSAPNFNHVSTSSPI